MFDIFRKEKENTPEDVKGIRHGLLQFIKEQLQKVEGGEGANIKGLHLFVFSPESERHLYEAALFCDDADRFKEEEVQKIADDYAIALPPDWMLHVVFTEAVPDEAVKSATVKAALQIVTRSKTLAKKGVPALIKVLNGITDREVYSLQPTKGNINIGREKKVQIESGFFRMNTIAFTSDSNEESNRSVSRQHAHIEWDDHTGAYMLFADEGGVPPRNKVKVRSVGSEPIKLQTTGIGHQLQEGDQIIIGESALLEFSYEGAT